MVSEDPICPLWFSPHLIVSKVRAETLSRYPFLHSLRIHSFFQ